VSNLFRCPNCDVNFQKGYRKAYEEYLTRLELAMIKKDPPHYVIIKGNNDNIMRDIQFQKDSAFDLLAELIVMRKNKTSLDGYLKFTEKVQKFLEDYEYIKIERGSENEN
jgi:uncharacterized C2H2 Zn-finger protein